MGPIGEGEALILRVTRNCPWNKCLFCPVYKGRKFGFRSVIELKEEIDTIKRLEELIVGTSREIGYEGYVDEIVLNEIIGAYPEIYGNVFLKPAAKHLFARQTLNNVANWLLYKKKRVFLQDADTLAMKPEELTEVLRYLKNSFPEIETITSYARSKTCSKRSPGDFRELKDAGLSWLFVGLESGCDEVLNFMRKGVTSGEHVAGGCKVMGAGLRLAVFVMPGLGGNDGPFADNHSRDTINVLNEIRPTEVRVRSLAVLEGSPLYDKWKSGEFDAPGEDRMIDEIECLINRLNFDCSFETLQMTNVLFNTKGRLFDTKMEMLADIGRYKSLSLIERLRFRFERYLSEGYLDIIMRMGRGNTHLNRLIREAQTSLDKEMPDAEAKTEQAIFAIKSKGVP